MAIVSWKVSVGSMVAICNSLKERDIVMILPVQFDISISIPCAELVPKMKMLPSDRSKPTS